MNKADILGFATAQTRGTGATTTQSGAEAASGKPEITAGERESFLRSLSAAPEMDTQAIRARFQKEIAARQSFLAQLSQFETQAHVTSNNAPVALTKIAEVDTQKNPRVFPVFSPDGEKLMVQQRRTIAQVDAATGKTDWARTEDPMSTPVYSPDGKYVTVNVAVRGKDYNTQYGLLQLDAKTGKQIFFIATEHSNENVSPAYSPDGAKLAQNDGGNLSVLDPANGKPIWQDNPYTSRWLTSASSLWTPEFSADGSTLPVNRQEIHPEKVFARDAATGKTIFEKETGTRIVTVLFPSPDGSKAAVFTSDNRLFMLDPKSGETIWSRGDSNPSNGLISLSQGYSPDGSKYAVGTNEGKFMVLDANTGELLTEAKLDGEADGEPAFSPDGGKVAIRSGGDWASYPSAKLEIFALTETGVKTAPLSATKPIFSTTQSTKVDPRLIASLKEAGFTGDEMVADASELRGDPESVKNVLANEKGWERIGSQSNTLRKIKGDSMQMVMFLNPECMAPGRQDRVELQTFSSGYWEYITLDENGMVLSNRLRPDLQVQAC